jgi:hypothetical protein
VQQLSEWPASCRCCCSAQFGTGVTDFMEVPKTQVGRIIGKGGETIKVGALSGGGGLLRAVAPRLRHTVSASA